MVGSVESIAVIVTVCTSVLPAPSVAVTVTETVPL